MREQVSPSTKGKRYREPDLSSLDSFLSGKEKPPSTQYIRCLHRYRK